LGPDEGVYRPNAGPDDIASLGNDNTLISMNLEQVWHGCFGTSIGALPSNGPIILVFGLISSGKTSFINKVTGSNQPIGPEDEFTPFTEQCHLETKRIGGVNVSFIDTPGFKNSLESNKKAIKEVTA
jgi:hypothetical protein